MPQGGYVGNRPFWNTEFRSGAWNIEDIYYRQRDNNWNPTIDPFFDNVAFYLKGDGENNSTNIVDSSIHNLPVTILNNVRLSTANRVFGVSSISNLGFTGQDRLRIEDAKASVSAISFTLETFVFPTVFPNNVNNTPFIFSQELGQTNNSGALSVCVDHFRIGTARRIEFTPLQLGNWHHLAVTYDADLDIFRMFVNGQIVGTTNQIYSHANMVRWHIMGSTNGSATFRGLVDSCRLTRGIIRYTTDFDPYDANTTYLKY